MPVERCLGAQLFEQLSSRSTVRALFESRGAPLDVLLADRPRPEAPQMEDHEARFDDGHARVDDGHPGVGQVLSVACGCLPGSVERAWWIAIEARSRPSPLNSIPVYTL